jgi:hypothetical protein
MLFEPHTRTGMLQRLDADSGVACGTPTGFALAWVCNPLGFFWVLALGGCILLLSSSAMAQTSHAASTENNPSTKSSTVKPPVHHRVHRRHHGKRSGAMVSQPAAVPSPPPPAEQPAQAASVDFKNGLLSVHAENSSLIGILDQVQHQTGLLVEGLTHDQRIYGQYGPANISTTLSALLDGSGYDFVIVGNASSRTPPRLILSPPGAVGAGATPQPAPAAVEAQPSDNAQTPPPVASEGDAPQAEEDQGGPSDPTVPPQPKTPQQIFNEMRRMNPQ